jgi:hypothetical protein
MTVYENVIIDVDHAGGNEVKGLGLSYGVFDAVKLRLPWLG